MLILSSISSQAAQIGLGGITQKYIDTLLASEYFCFADLVQSVVYFCYRGADDLRFYVLGPEPGAARSVGKRLTH